MVTIRKLENGITCVMEPLSYVGSCALGIWVRTGSVNEVPENSGISHFIEHMMFKGTKKRTAKQIAEDVDNLGGQINAFTGKEATCYYIRTLTENLGPAMDILFDMFTGSTFDTEEMNRERNVIKEEMKMIQDSPDEDAQDTILELVFKGNALGKSIIGTNESLDGIDRNAILSYLDEEYTRDNVIVSIAGNFDPDEAAAVIEEKTSSMKAEAVRREYENEAYEPSYKVKVKDIEQSHISMAVRTIPYEDEDRYAFSLLSSIMGGSMSSRFFQNIRERKGLAYSVYSVNSSFKRGGYFDIYAGVAHDNVEKAVEAVREELLLLKKNGVTKAELSKAKEQMKSSYIFGQESVSNRMFSQGKNVTLLGKNIGPDEVMKLIDGVTMEDIERAADVITDIDSYSGVAVTNRDINIEKMIRG